VHAGGGADNGEEKRKVLIVSLLLPIIIDLALRSKTQRGIEVLQMQPILLRAATAPKALKRDAEVEDQAPAASLVSQVVPNLTSPRSWPALAVTPCWVRTVCPAVRKRGPSTETIQSCA
jgi:hypothetical protein